MIELVVARYEEDISWLEELHDIYSKIIIYNKGSPLTTIIPKSEVYCLPNDGREGYVYLHHVIQNYNTLADITLFVQGSAWSTADKQHRLLRTINALKQIGTSSVIYGNKDPIYIKSVYNFKIDNYKITNLDNLKKNPESSLYLCKDRPLGKWFRKHFPNENIRCVSFMGTVAALRTDIQKRPVEFYKNLFEEVSHKNPEVEHYLERTWKNVFSIPFKNCFDF